MKTRKVGAGITILLIIITVPLIGGQIDNEYPKDTKFEKIQTQDLVLTISQSSNLIGVTLSIENTGSEILSDISWSFRHKAAITGTGFFINEKLLNGTIEELGMGDIETFKFIPFGLGNIYYNASVEVNDVSYRTQQRAYLFFVTSVMFKDTYKDITPTETYERWENQEFDLIIDVVGLDIYSAGHLPGAVNYIWADGTLRSKIPDLDPFLTYLVYCHTDPPSTDSAQAMVNAGITDVFRLEGNYAAWKNAGYPIEI